MDLRPLDEITAVAPQLEPGDMAALARDGVAVVICNRPDVEVPPPLQAAAMRAAAEAAGLAFVENPVAMPGVTEATVAAQAEAVAGPGRAVAYCASGTRSAVLWALAMAGSRPTDDILVATARAGYDLEGLRPQLDALAAR
jgi:uncharacterized protein (TIGR01244 family)